MYKENWTKKVSELEFLNDQLQTEICYLNQLLCKVGFEQGIHTLKCTAEEILREDKML